MADRKQPPTLRRSTRLPGYDYGMSGWYFVTICVSARRQVLGVVTAKGEVRLSDAGAMVAACIADLPKVFPRAQVDRWVILPDHLHLLLYLRDVTREVERHNLSTIIGWLKAESTRRIHAASTALPGSLWQRSFHDHIVRPYDDLASFRYYITRNPARWAARTRSPR